jgi:CheY-like chemotaxis protein
LEATRIIRTEIGTEYAENIPIIALTANAITGNEEMFLNKGFSAFISKPIEIARLDSVIRKWVRDENLEASEAELEEETESAPSKILPFHSFHNDGVDLYRGLERFGDDEESYLQVLRSYAANTRLVLEKIKNVNPDNLNDYAIIVHGIKGSSYGICANTAAEKAEALEKSSKAGDIGFVNDNNTEFITVVEKLLTDLDNMLNELKSCDSKPTKASPDKEVLNRISAACKNYDMDIAEAAIRELEMYNYETGGELVAWLWENVQQFNIEQIIEKLSSTLEEKI